MGTRQDDDGTQRGASSPEETAGAAYPGGESPAPGTKAADYRAGFACLVGRPNAGKSTLTNALVGQKVAITSSKPQTTRHRILGVKNYPEGQIAFVDTPGIHRPLHRLNVRMVDSAVETFREVDVIALVFDASTRPGRGDEFGRAVAQQRLFGREVEFHDRRRSVREVEDAAGHHVALDFR